MAHSEHHHDVYHVTPFKTYAVIFGALVFLTVVTVILSVRVTGISFGALGPLVAFGIATVKAGMVLAYFMHLKYDSLLNRLVLASAFFFLLLLYVICAIDLVTRSAVESTL